MASTKSFVLRLDPKLFADLRKQAADHQTSINSFCVSLLNQHQAAPSPQLAGVAEHLHRAFGKDLLAVVLFGSTARGTQTATSDIDIMIALKNTIPLGASLYRRWDEYHDQHPDIPLASKLSPHFVNLIDDTQTAGSLWLEVALEGKILWAESALIENKLRELRQLIAEGVFKRCYSYGVPYWKKVA